MKNSKDEALIKKNVFRLSGIASIIAFIIALLASSAVRRTQTLWEYLANKAKQTLGSFNGGSAMGGGAGCSGTGCQGQGGSIDPNTGKNSNDKD